MAASRVGLTAVERFVLPRSVLTLTLDVLASAGRRGLEGIVVWTGVLEAEVRRFRFTRVVAPEQTAYRTPDGLLVLVSGEALFGLNRDAYARGEIVAGQAHSHPGDAYHSETDDHLAIVTLLGAISLVVPDFASGISERGWFWARLTHSGQWSSFDPDGTVEIG